jgi:hypothetical protein
MFRYSNLGHGSIARRISELRRIVLVWFYGLRPDGKYQTTKREVAGETRTYLIRNQRPAIKSFGVERLG